MTVQNTKRKIKFTFQLQSEINNTFYDVRTSGGCHVDSYKIQLRILRKVKYSVVSPVQFNSIFRKYFSISSIQATTAWAPNCLKVVVLLHGNLLELGGYYSHLY